MSKHKLVMEIPPAKRIKLSKAAQQDQNGSPTSLTSPLAKQTSSPVNNGVDSTQTIQAPLDESKEDDIKINEQKSDHIEIEIDNESDKFLRETLKHFKFFQTKFSQRWTKTKLQNDNKMSLKQVGFKMKHFKILINFVEDKFKKQRLDLSCTHHCKTITELRKELNPLLLCNDFFECIYMKKKTKSRNDTCSCAGNIHFKSIASYIGDCVRTCSNGIDVAAQQKWLQNEHSQTMIEALKQVEQVRLRIIKNRDFNHNDISRVGDATARIESFLQNLRLFKDPFNSDRDENAPDGNYYKMSKTWKIILKNYFLSDEILARVLQICLDIEVECGIGYPIKNDTKRARIAFKIIGDLVKLAQIKMENKLLLIDKQIGLAIYMDNTEIDLYNEFGAIVNEMTQKECVHFATIMAKHFSHKYNFNYQITCNTKARVEHIIKLCEIMLYRMKIDVTNFFKCKEIRFSFTIIVCLCQHEIGINWLQTEFAKFKNCDILLYLKQFIDCAGDFYEWGNEMYDLYDDWPYEDLWIMRLYCNVIKIFAKLGGKVYELNGQRLSIVVKTLLEAGDKEGSEFVVGMIRNHLCAEQAEPVFEELYNDDHYRDDVMNDQVFCAFLDKVYFHRVCRPDYLRYVQDMLRRLDDCQYLEKWFESIFIGKKQAAMCSIREQQNVAGVIADYLSEGRYDSSIAMIKFVNATLGTKLYVKDESSDESGEEANEESNEESNKGSD